MARAVRNSIRLWRLISASNSEAADSGEGVADFMSLIGLVVPIEFAGVLVLRQLVRAVAVRLVLRQAALAQPDLLAFDRVFRRFLGRAFDQPGHGASCVFDAASG